MVFHWSLGDSKTPPVSLTFPSNLAVLNNIVVWITPLICQLHRPTVPLIILLLTVLKAPITISIIVTFISHSFFNSLVVVVVIIIIIIIYPFRVFHISIS